MKPNTEPPDLTAIIIGVLLAIATFLTAGQWLTVQAAALINNQTTLTVSANQVIDALKALPDTWQEPAQAWPTDIATQLPGPWIYWPVGITIHLLLLGALVALAMALRVRPDPIERRERLGVEAQARTASPSDLRALRIKKPTAGRYYLGKVRRRQLATEPPQGNKRHRTIPGAVAVIAPSRSGKTFATINSANQWQGPAILSSVKRDLIDGTLEHRREIGEVRFYDHKTITGETPSFWTPLDRSKTRSGATQMARLLLNAKGHDKTVVGGFWSDQAEGLLGGLLWLAANTDHTIADVAYWIAAFDHPHADAPGIAAGLLRALTKSDSPLATDAKQIHRQLQGIWNMDTRMASSYYVSARLAVQPWADPIVESSAICNQIDLDWLTSGDNTLYIVAPAIDQAIIAPALGGLIGDLVTQLMDRVDLQQRPLDRELLLVLDEAANTPITQLPQWSSLLTGYGLQLVTIWQAKSQIDAIYGKAGDALLTNHRSKIFYGGMTDITTIDYLTRLLGHEHQPGIMQHAGTVDPRTINPTQVALAPPNVLRGIGVGEALLLHGSLPPIHLTAT